MVWVAMEAARRLRRTTGTFRASEWERYAEIIGITCRWAALPVWQPAILARRTLFLRDGLTNLEAAWWAWHELGHVALHPGNARRWDSLPWGHLVLSKQEQQANEFALLFPEWGD